MIVTALRDLSSEARESLALRVWAKVDAEGDCWQWTAAVSPRGYGRIRVGGTATDTAMWMAHRAVWELLIGDCPADLEPDHMCLNTGCVNPDHIEWVTHAENIRRCKSWAGERQRRKTHCPWGHQDWGFRKAEGYDTLHRFCKTCHHERPGRWAA